MNSSASPSALRKSGALEAFALRYRTALTRYARSGASASLQSAKRLGQAAVLLGAETLELALVHEKALLGALLSVKDPAVRERIVRRSGAFFVEALIPVEGTHRAALETNAHLSRMNEALSARTLDLNASNRQLKREISHRLVIEASLRKSEQRSSRLLQQSRQLQLQLQRLSRRILSVQEEERKRISRELHDVIAQMLTGINVQLSALLREAAASTRGISKKISNAQRLVEKSVDSVHQFARELRPALLDDLGLAPALQSFLKSFSAETGIRGSLSVFAGLEELSSAKRTVLYRVAQEAVTNVARHAHAQRVEVRVEQLSRTVRMRIQDDGKSFDVDRMWNDPRNLHLGMLGMRERLQMVGGSLAVASAPGKGTTVDAQVPFAPRTGGATP